MRTTREGRPMKLAKILFSQGFGTRRACEGLASGGHVEIDGRVHDDPFEELDPEGLVLRVEGQPWPCHATALIAMNKPAGYECSAKPRHHPSVYGLLPAPLRRRDVQCVGRLDEDTTGLLLFTDDGTLLHRWTSPKHHLPKVYDVSCRHPVDAEALQRLLDGVVLHDDPRPVQALAAEPWDGASAGLHGVRLTLAEGKYHQVKRMLAAVGNRVEALHRSRFGVLELPAGLAPGQWSWLSGPSEVTG
jgi:16S rRNA pseudouridine516 synthase